MGVDICGDICEIILVLRGATVIFICVESEYILIWILTNV